MKTISELENEYGTEDSFLNDDTCRFVFYDTTLEEMSRVCKIPKTKYELHIEGGEGNIPHFHLCIQTGKNIILRIQLLANTYFREKDDACNTLTSKDRNLLDTYLRKMYNEEYEITYWQYLCMEWNKFNPSHRIQNIKSKIQPDYKTIKEPN